MATHIIPILGITTAPDTAGQVFQENYTRKATNDVWGLRIWVFNDTSTRKGLRGLFRVPENYVGTPKILAEWTSTATSGDVEWDFDYRAIALGESLDQTTNVESLNVLDTAPASVNLRLVVELTPTATLAVGDLVEFELFRDGSDAGDTMAAAAMLFGLYFSYADA